MNTNYAETGVRVGLRKVGNDVHLDLETDAGKASLVIDDSKSVYSALHAVKDELAMLVSKTVDSILSFVHRTDPAPALLSDIDEAHGRAILEDAARAPALPSLSVTSEIDGAHAAALLEDEARSLGLISAGAAAAVLDGKQVATKVEGPRRSNPPSDVYEGRIDPSKVWDLQKLAADVPITTPTGEKPAA